MELTARISAEKLEAQVAKTADELIDTADVDSDVVPAGRSSTHDARPVGRPGDLDRGVIVSVKVEDADAHDLRDVLHFAQHARADGLWTPGELPPREIALPNLVRAQLR